MECSLCHGTSSSGRYILMSKYDDSTLNWLRDVTEEAEISLSNVVCRACNLYIERHKGEVSCTRWKKHCKATLNEICAVKECVNETCRKAPDTAGIALISDILGEIVEPIENENVRLCNIHYQKLYKILHSPEPCVTCGETPRFNARQYFYRHCPDPIYISKYIKDVEGMNVTITKESIVCNECYEKQYRLIQKSENEPDLCAIVSMLEASVAVFKSAEQVTELEYIQGIASLTALELSHKLLVEEAMLLLDLYEIFSQFAVKYMSKVKEYILPGSRWLQVYLSNVLKNNLGIAVRHRCFGTLLFKKDGDILNALSKALGELKSTKKSELKVRKQLSESMYYDKPQSTCTVSTDTIISVCKHLNKVITSNAKTLAEYYSSDPYHYSKFTFDELANSIDDVLITAIKVLTEPTRGKRKVLVKEDYESNFIKQIYCLLVILFTTNNQCHPLHFILTDSILCHHGSSTLVKIFNRIGACVSMDTHDRITNQIAIARLNNGIIPYLIPNTLCVITIDNVDILQPYAIVSAIKSRSWHGTSIQCIQPRPITIRTGKNDQLALIDHDTALQSKRRNSSPIMSPVLKQVSKHPRTLTEKSSHTALVMADISETQFDYISNSGDYCTCPLQYSISDFNLAINETERLQILKNVIFQYMASKSIWVEETSFPTLCQFISSGIYGHLDNEKAKIHIMEVLSLKADSKDTIMVVLKQIYDIFICQLQLKWIMVVGDAKTYDILQNIKKEHRLCWLVVFPGDWHLLYNYQKAIIKAYWDAGLNQLAQAAGHKAETLTSLSTASNFRRTHRFFLQVFEAYYLSFISSFLQSCPDAKTKLQGLHPILSELKQASSHENLEDVITSIQSWFIQNNLQASFVSHIDETGNSDETFRFWSRLINIDILAYIALFVSIRNSDWQLRVASIKSMAAIFFAFDRPIYKRLVATHLADLLCIPQELLHYFEDNGAFSVHITNRPGHATAMDETHEMVINRIIKDTVVKPNPELMQRISHAFEFRSDCQNQIKQQVGLVKKGNSFIDDSKDVKVADTNVTKMVQLIEAKQVLSTTSACLANKFLGVDANLDQRHDLLTFRDIGQREFENHVSFRILRNPSTQAPSRLKKLKTFTVTKQTKQKAKQIDRERKLIETCTQKQLSLYRTGKPISSNLNPPYIPLPRALVDENGFPHKASKASPTNFFKSRYSSANVVINDFPPNWVPDCVLLEGMFLIQTTPILGAVKFDDYCKLLIKRFVLPHFKKGVTEVHVIFDCPSLAIESPKEIERSKRDNMHETKPHHIHAQITENGDIPTNWRDDVINCRHCKSNLCNFLGTRMLDMVQKFLTDGQRFYSSGGFMGDMVNKCIFVTNADCQFANCLESNLEETDLRIWLHCKLGYGRKKLIYSPDTDVYHIGLPLVDSGYDIYIQQKPSIHENTRYLSITNLINALNTDPDLADIPIAQRPQAFQTLYITSGCDYISFFKGIGKLFFMQVFYKQAAFISSGLNVPGTLGDIQPDGMGFLAFIRLVGSAYFFKHRSGFLAVSPQNLYNAYSPDLDIIERHKRWLSYIRQIVWGRVAKEELAIPSWEALQLHWRRSTWILLYWSKAADNGYITMPKLTDYGWKREDGILQIVWDTNENMQEISTKVAQLTKGCKCKKGCTGRCGCRREGHECGPGCACINCTNRKEVNHHQSTEDLVAQEQQQLDCSDDDNECSEDEYIMIDEYDDVDEDLDNYYETLENDIDDMMMDIFGD